MATAAHRIGSSTNYLSGEKACTVGQLHDIHKLDRKFFFLKNIMFVRDDDLKLKDITFDNFVGLMITNTSIFIIQ